MYMYVNIRIYVYMHIYEHTQKRRGLTREDGWGVDYGDVIREPLDLGSIRDRLDEAACGGYDTLADVAADVMLVFKNAMTFNGEKSQIHQNAAQAMRFFESDLVQTTQQLCEKGVAALQAKEAKALESYAPDDSLDAAEAEADSTTHLQMRGEYLAPQAVAPLLQCKLEEWDRRQNWIDSFDHTVPMPSGWQVVGEPKTSKVYFWNKNTTGAGTTTWDQPKPPRVAQATPLARVTRVNQQPLPDYAVQMEVDGADAAPAQAAHEVGVRAEGIVGIPGRIAPSPYLDRYPPCTIFCFAVCCLKLYCY